MLTGMNLISPRLHGAIDYVACASMLALPVFFGLRPAAQTASFAFAGTYLLVSGLTDYPLALKRVIPFPVHGRIELASVPALLLLPSLMGALKDGKARAYFIGLAGTVLQYRTTRVLAAPGAGKGLFKRPKYVSASVPSHRIAWARYSQP